LAPPVERSFRLAQKGLVLPRSLPRRLPRHRLDAAHARRDAALGNDEELADVAGAAAVRAATQLLRVAGNRHDADALSVLLTEEGDRPSTDRLVVSPLRLVHGGVDQDLLVDLPLRLEKIRRADRSGEIEVEAQPVRADVRAGQ